MSYSKECRTANTNLNENQVRDIRRQAAAGVTTRELSDRYGIGQETVRRIVRRDSWKWLDQRADEVEEYLNPLRAQESAELVMRMINDPTLVNTRGDLAALDAITRAAAPKQVVAAAAYDQAKAWGQNVDHLIRGDDSGEMKGGKKVVVPEGAGPLAAFIRPDPDGDDGVFPKNELEG